MLFILPRLSAYINPKDLKTRQNSPVLNSPRRPSQLNAAKMPPFTVSTFLTSRGLRTLIQRPPQILTQPRRNLTNFTFQPTFRTQAAAKASPRPTTMVMATTIRQFSTSPVRKATYNQVRRGCRVAQRARRAKSPALANTPQLKGVCLKTGITKPKKPNSGERKTARVRLSSGKVITAYIPGEG